MRRHGFQNESRGRRVNRRETNQTENLVNQKHRRFVSGRGCHGFCEGVSGDNLECHENIAIFSDLGKRTRKVDGENTRNI